MDKSHFRILGRIYYGENYIDVAPPGQPAPARRQGVFEVTCAGKVHRFEFDASKDNPAEGATLK